MTIETKYAVDDTAFTLLNEKITYVSIRRIIYEANRAGDKLAYMLTGYPDQEFAEEVLFESPVCLIDDLRQKSEVKLSQLFTDWQKTSGHGDFTMPGRGGSNS